MRIHCCRRCPLQVEDVNKKFEALRAAESRGWTEEHKPPPRQKKVVKVSEFSFHCFKTLSHLLHHAVVSNEASKGIDRMLPWRCLEVPSTLLLSATPAGSQTLLQATELSRCTDKLIKLEYFKLDPEFLQVLEIIEKA